MLAPGEPRRSPRLAEESAPTRSSVREPWLSLGWPARRGTRQGFALDIYATLRGE